VRGGKALLGVYVVEWVGRCAVCVVQFCRLVIWHGCGGGGRGGKKKFVNHMTRFMKAPLVTREREARNPRLLETVTWSSNLNSKQLQDQI
jgi:hypothetical protein